MNRRLVPLAALAIGAVLVLGPVAGSAPVLNVATSQAFAIRIIVPGLPPVTGGYVSAPNDSTVADAGFSYPSDGSVLTSGAITSNASANPTGTTVLAAASVEMTGISLFGGEMTVQVVDAKVTATAGTLGGTGDFTGTAVSDIGGSAVVGNQLGTWGTFAVGTGAGVSTEDSGAHG